jgi:endo-1,4-beta-xylanase
MRRVHPPAAAATLTVLLGLATAYLASCSGPSAPDEAGRRPPPTTSPSTPACEDPATCTTRQLAERAGVTFGTAVTARYLDEAPYRRTLLETFNSITPENELKWSSVHPGPDEWDFGPADGIVAFAEANGLQVKGHNLLWDQAIIGSTPEWVLQITDPAELRRVIGDHLTTLMHRYRGRVDRWDVVNEPLETTGSSLYRNHFQQVLGDGYIAEAFQIAHEADPEARLFLNEAAVEYQPEKAAALVALAKDLRDRGVPLHGVGIQGHLVTGSLGPGVLRDLISELAALGLEVAITELDVPAGAGAEPLEMQANTYRQAFAECFDAGCREITTWGFTDRYTWMDDFFGPGRAPLPFDQTYQPKPALGAIRDQLLLLPAAS